MTAAAKLLGCFKGGQRVFGEIAKKSEGMVLSRGEKVWFSDCLLPSAKFLKEALVRG